MDDTKRIISTSILQDVADGIRNKTGINTSIKSSDFALNISRLRIDASRCLSTISGSVFKVEINTWSSFTWNTLPSNFSQHDIWTDGVNIYYSSGDYQYVLDKATSTWNPKIWYGSLKKPKGSYIWTDGTNIYSSDDNRQYVLDKATSTWNPKTWYTMRSFKARHLWTDGENIYCSNQNAQYVLDKATSTWNPKTWYGLEQPFMFTAGNVWTDGENIYAASYYANYVLDKATSTWNPKTWYGLTEFMGCDIWTDGINIYARIYDHSLQAIVDYKLDIEYRLPLRFVNY